MHHHVCEYCLLLLHRQWLLMVLPYCDGKRFKRSPDPGVMTDGINHSCAKERNTTGLLSYRLRTKWSWFSGYAGYATR